jgi:hypothetical protein
MGGVLLPKFKDTTSEARVIPTNFTTLTVSELLRLWYHMLPTHELTLGLVAAGAQRESASPSLEEGRSLGFKFRTTLGNQNTRKRQSFILVFRNFEQASSESSPLWAYILPTSYFLYILQHPTLHTHHVKVHILYTLHISYTHPIHILYTSYTSKGHFLYILQHPTHTHTASVFVFYFIGSYYICT